MIYARITLNELRMKGVSEDAIEYMYYVLEDKEPAFLWDYKAYLWMATECRNSRKEMFCPNLINELVIKGVVLLPSMDKIVANRANLSNLYLYQASIRQSLLKMANLSAVNGIRMDISGSNLYKSIIRKSNLMGADFSRCLLYGCDFRGSVLISADMEDCDASVADFSEVDMSRAFAVGAGFSGAVFDKTKMADAIFANADFRGADLSTATGLAHAFLKGARYDWVTRFPDDFSPVRKGMLMVASELIDDPG